MLRCQHCQFDNQGDALACARCGHALPRNTAAAPPSSESKLPDWLQAIDLGHPPAGPESGSDSTNHRAGNVGHVGAVAAVAALPVQVRRSRVPLVMPDRPLTPVSESVLPLDMGEPGDLSVKDGTVGPRRSNRRLAVLVAILVVLLIVLGYFIIGR